jgi:hypothetical protein
MGNIARMARAGLAGILAAGAATYGHAAEGRYIVDYADEFQVVTWDNASVRRSPDEIVLNAVAFDLPFLRNGTEPLKERAFSVRISCGFRAVWLSGDFVPALALWPDDSKNMLQFLTEPDPFTDLTDHLCAGGTTNHNGVERDALQATIGARWNPPGSVIPPLPLSASGRPKWEDVPAWADQIHRFTPIRGAARPDARTYLDRSSIQLEGNIANALTLTLLGTATPRGGPSEMRRNSYDCGQRTLSVQARIVWDATGRLKILTDLPGPTRSQGESPVTAAEIAAACASRPAPRRKWTSSCVWNTLSPNQRAVWIGNRNRLAPVLYGQLRQLLTSCDVPLEDEGEVLHALSQRSIQYSATQRLVSNRAFSFQARLLATVKAVPAEDLQRLTPSSSAPSDRAVQERIVRDLARSLDVSAPRDIEALRELTTSQAVIEYGLGLSD